MYIFHEDPGHGWLEVPVSELLELGIINQISEFSYLSLDRKTAYLEEDCDLAVFFNAKKETDSPIIFDNANPKCNVKEKVYQTQSAPLRNLPSFK